MLAVLGTLLVGAISVVNAGAAPQPPVFWRCVPHEGGEYKDAECTKYTEGAGRYSEERGAGAVGGFSATGRALELQTQSHAFTLTCASSRLQGTFTVEGPYEVSLTLKGCHAGSDVCSSAGMPARTIVSGKLAGDLGWLHEDADEAGVDLAGEAGPISEFECYAPSDKFTAANLQLRGSMIGQLAGDVGTFSKKFSLTFARGRAPRSKALKAMRRMSLACTTWKLVPKKGSNQSIWL